MKKKIFIIILGIWYIVWTPFYTIGKFIYDYIYNCFYQANRVIYIHYKERA